MLTGLFLSTAHSDTPALLRKSGAVPALGSLASYARKGDDAELEEMTARIRTRAMRRVGELLQAIEPAKGRRQAK